MREQLVPIIKESCPSVVWLLSSQGWFFKVFYPCHPQDQTPFYKMITSAVWERGFPYNQPQSRPLRLHPSCCLSLLWSLCMAHKPHSPTLRRIDPRGKAGVSMLCPSHGRQGTYWWSLLPNTVRPSTPKTKQYDSNNSNKNSWKYIFALTPERGE